MKKQISSFVMIVAGLLLLAAGLFMIKAIGDPQGIMRALPYVCVGLGCGIFGHGLGDVISRRSMKNSPNVAKQLDIEKNDERNIAVGNRAKAKAYDMMLSVFGALIVALALMGIDMVVVLLFVFAYLFVAGCGVYYRCKYDKEM